MSSESIPPGFVDAWAFPGEPTLSGPVPAGFRETVVSRVVGRGETVARVAGDAVLAWQVHHGSGFVPLQVPDRVHVGAVSLWAVPFGPLRPRVACRVVRVLDDEPVGDGRRSTGFLHAALVGHPQRGWESYLATRHPDDRVTLDIRVVWRPGAWWMRLAGPLSRLALRLLLRRNLRSLDAVLRVRD